MPAAVAAAGKGMVSLRVGYAPQSGGSGRATGNDGRSAADGRKCYSPIPSRRERRIYAANAAVRRRVKVWRAYGLGMPRGAGAVAAPQATMGGVPRTGYEGQSARMGNERQSATNGQRGAERYEWASVIYLYVTARETHLCGERGSPAVGKVRCACGVVAPQGGGKRIKCVCGHICL